MKTARDDRYLNAVRAKDCCACGRFGPSQAAHVRIGNGGGIGLKPSDYFTVPLCAWCHSNQHSYGEKTFWKRAGKDPDVIIAGLLMSYIVDRKIAKEALALIAQTERQGDAAPAQTEE